MSGKSTTIFIDAILKDFSKRSQKILPKIVKIMTTILIGGGSGLIGMRLSEILTKKGYQVLHLSRTPKTNALYPTYVWDIEKGTIEEEALQKADYLINLAGTGIADERWTSERKNLIISSRVNSTRTFKKYIETAPGKYKAFISASAIGYYGNRGDEILTETSSPGTSGFLAKSVIEWENAIQEIVHTGIRTVTLRIGLVLSTQGGALPKIALPAKLGVGSYFGDGRQWYAWIHIEDLCAVFLNAIENERLEGIYNAVAPEPVRNKEFAVQMGQALRKKLLLISAPVFALRAGLGEMADAVLGSARIHPTRLEASGFVFQFRSLVAALQDLFRRSV